MTRSHPIACLLLLATLASCEPPPAPPGLVLVGDDRALEGTYSREGAVVTFQAEAMDDQHGARLTLDVAGKPLELTLDVERGTFTEDAHGSTFALSDRALLLSLRDAIGVAHPEIIDTLPGAILARGADRYAEVPVGKPRTRLDISLGTTGEGEGKGDKVENYACRDDGTTCFPGTYGQSWAVFGSDAIGGCFAHQAYYGDSVCRGRCGAGCSFWDEDYMWDCFDHDVCLDYTNSCDFEWDDASDDWVVTWGPYCSSGSTRSKPPGTPVCGNGDIEAGEACDDDATLPGDGCDAACQLEPLALAISVAGPVAINRDQRVQGRLLGSFADGTTRDLTQTAAWTSSDPAAATVTAGQIDGVAAGAATITASIAGKTATLDLTVRDVACTLTINEVQIAGATAADEWVEIHNGCIAPIDATGWTLVYRSAEATGTADSAVLIALAGTIESGQILLYTSASASPSERLVADGQWTHGGGNGALARLGGGVGLRTSAGQLVESVGYGKVAPAHPFVEGGLTAPGPAAGSACARAGFDGADSDVNAADFAIATPTPRQTNG